MGSESIAHEATKGLLMQRAKATIVLVSQLVGQKSTETKCLLLDKAGL